MLSTHICPLPLLLLPLLLFPLLMWPASSSSFSISRTRSLRVDTALFLLLILRPFLAADSSPEPHSSCGVKKKS